MKIERNRDWNKYTFIPEDKKDEKFLDKINKKIDELEKENKNLKLIQETNEKQIQNDIKERDELRKENKKLKEELEHYKNTDAIQKSNADSMICWTYTISKI